MSTIVPGVQGQLARDAKGQPAELVSVDNWRAYRADITAGAWVLLGDGSPRNHILIHSLAANADNLILAPASTGYSNDPAVPTCGIELAPGSKMEPSMTANLPIYARTVDGGGTVRVSISEAL